MPNRRRRKLSTAMSAVAALAGCDFGDRLVDRRLAFEKAVDIGRRHLAGLGNVGDRGLAVADRAKQPLGLGQDAVTDFGLGNGCASHMMIFIIRHYQVKTSF